MATRPANIEVNGYRKPTPALDRRQGPAEAADRERPAVAVWTADHLAAFLSKVTDDPLFAFWWLAALRGLRRGGMCGLLAERPGLGPRSSVIERNRTTAGYQIVEGPPKTESGRPRCRARRATVKILRAHRRRQLDQRNRCTETGRTWVDSGYVFTRSDGLPINPNYATTRFRLLVRAPGCRR
jgi:hypothetical protein